MLQILSYQIIISGTTKKLRVLFLCSLNVLHMFGLNYIVRWKKNNSTCYVSSSEGVDRRLPMSTL